MWGFWPLTYVWDGYLDHWKHSWLSLLKKIQTQPDQTWKRLILAKISSTRPLLTPNMGFLASIQRLPYVGRLPGPLEPFLVVSVKKSNWKRLVLAINAINAKPNKIWLDPSDPTNYFTKKLLLLLFQSECWWCDVKWYEAVRPPTQDTI